jgi:hypothetical protein
MTDAEFIQAAESCMLPESDFRHVGHVRAGYGLLLQFYSPAQLGSELARKVSLLPLAIGHESGPVVFSSSAR